MNNIKIMLSSSLVMYLCNV